MSRLIAVLTVLLSSVCVSSAFAQTFRVVARNADDPPLCNGTQFYDSGNVASGTNLTIPLSTCATRINITATSTAVNIGRLTLTGGPSQYDVDVIFGSATTINQSDILGTVVGNHWAGLDTSGMGFPDRVRLSGSIGGNLTGSIRVGQLFRFDVLGQIQSQVRSTYAGNFGGIFVVQAGSISSTGSVVLDNGNILRVRTTNGSILGPITVGTGRIWDVFAASDFGVNLHSNGALRTLDVGGNIGSFLAPVSITTQGNGGNIDLVRGARIYANITTPNTSTVRGDVKQIITTATAGPFVGSLTTFAMQGTDPGVATIDVEGDLDADIDVLTIKRPVVIGGAFKAGRTMRIQQDLKAEAPITITDSGGLEGQIILNAENGSVANPWAGTITIGTTSPVVLTGASSAYSNPSSQLGGGAVGLAPFQLHATDCIPVNGASILGPFPDSDNAVMIRHYGPVYWTSGMPVTVEYQTPGAGSWNNITGDFNVSAGPTDRDIIVWPATPLDFDGQLIYRIRPVRTGTNALKCQDVTGNPPVADYTYTLNLY